MSSEKDILQKVTNAIISGDIAAAEAAGKEALESSVDPETILEEGGSKGLEIVGQRFENLEMFLPEMLAASEAMKALNKLILPHLKSGKLAKKAERTFR